jgi:hypothetical protein
MNSETLLQLLGRARWSIMGENGARPLAIKC